MSSNANRVSVRLSKIEVQVRGVHPPQFRRGVIADRQVRNLVGEMLSAPDMFKPLTMLKLPKVPGTTPSMFPISPAGEVVGYSGEANGVPHRDLAWSGATRSASTAALRDRVWQKSAIS